MKVMRFKGFMDDVKRFDDDLQIRFTDATGEDVVVLMDRGLWISLTLLLVKRFLRIAEGSG